jgi:hypothetical protein
LADGGDLELRGRGGSGDQEGWTLAVDRKTFEEHAIGTAHALSAEDTSFDMPIPVSTSRVAKCLMHAVYAKAAGVRSPNPDVGAVLSWEDRIELVNLVDALGITDVNVNGNLLMHLEHVVFPDVIGGNFGQVRPADEAGVRMLSLAVCDLPPSGWRDRLMFWLRNILRKHVMNRVNTGNEEPRFLLRVLEALDSI